MGLRDKDPRHQQPCFCFSCKITDQIKTYSVGPICAAVRACELNTQIRVVHAPAWYYWLENDKSFASHKENHGI